MSEETITAFFQNDHDRLDGLFDQFQTIKACDYEGAKQHFKEFKRGLERHIVWEEEILFPLFETKSGMRESGPTAVMRMEHRQIKEALEQIHLKVREENSDSGGEETRLLQILSEHNRKEENILYPMVDRFVSEPERKAVFDRMKSFPEEKFGTCCTGH